MLHRAFRSLLAGRVGDAFAEAGIGLVYIASGLVLGCVVGAASASTGAPSLTNDDLLKVLGFLGALVGVYVALDRRLTTVETQRAADVVRLEQRMDGHRDHLADSLQAAVDHLTTLLEARK